MRITVELVLVFQGELPHRVQSGFAWLFEEEVSLKGTIVTGHEQYKTEYEKSPHGNGICR